MLLTGFVSGFKQLKVTATSIQMTGTMTGMNTNILTGRNHKEAAEYFSYVGNSTKPSLGFCVLQQTHFNYSDYIPSSDTDSDDLSLTRKK